MIKLICNKCGFCIEILENEEVDFLHEKCSICDGLMCLTVDQLLKRAKNE